MAVADHAVELEEHARDGLELRLGVADELDAELIRAILKSGKVRKDPRAEPAPADPPMVSPDPRGIRIHGGRISGELNLDGLPADSKVGLRFTDCRLERPIRLCDGGLPWLILQECALPGLLATGAQIGELAIRDSRVRSWAPGDGVRLERANVTNDVRFDGTRIDCGARAEDGSERAAVELRGAKIGGTLSMAGCRVGMGPALLTHRAVGLRGAEVDGPLVLTGAWLRGAAGPALDASLVTVKGGVWCDGTFIALGAGEGATVSLAGATITGPLVLDQAAICCSAAAPDAAEGPAAVSLTGATINGDLRTRATRLVSSAGPALLAERATVNGSAFGCHRPAQRLVAIGRGRRGALCLVGSTVTGALELSYSRLINQTGPALAADLLTVKGGTFLNHGFDAQGAVRLWGASLSGQLSLEAAVISNDLSADGGERGYAAALWLSTATIGGKLLLRNARLSSRAGAAIMADYLTVNGDAVLCQNAGEGLTAYGSDPLGTICLAAATINGQLTLCHSIVANRSNDARRRNPDVLLDEAKISGDALLPDIRRAVDGERAAVSLVGASVSKRLVCAVGVPVRGPGLDARFATVGELTLNTDELPERCPQDPPRWLQLDGLTFTGTPTLDPDPGPPRKRLRRLLGGWVDPGAEQWKRILSCAPFKPQPYAAVGSAYELAGDDSSARWLMIAQRDDARQRGGIGFPVTWYQIALKWLIGYGYRSIRAFYWLIAVFALTVVMSLGFAKAGIIKVPPNPPAQPKAARCGFPGDLDYAINLAFPVITLSGTAPTCDVPPHSSGAAVAASWVIRFLAITLAGFYAAGLTGITRSPP